MNKTYGRKIVKGTVKSKDYFYKRILIMMAICILIGGILGSIVTGIIVHNTNKNKSCRPLGEVDDRVFTSEISMDWGSAEELGFKPLDVPLKKETQEFIYCLSYGYNIDFSLVMALIETESGFNTNAVSRTDDYGLMQINKINHAWLKDTLGITDFLDAKQNIRAGLFVLRKLFEQNGNDVNKVLMAYNLGQSGAERFWKQGIHSISYSEKIIKRQHEFQKELKEKE